MNNTQQVKSVKKWVLLLIMPVVALIVVALAQMIVRFALTSVTETGLETQGSGDIIEVVINIFSLLVGTVSVVAIILTPLWLVMLVRDLKGHPRSKTAAVVLAVFFGYFSWIYTWEKNYKKFWMNLAISVVTLGYGSIIGWIWAIIDNASKPDEFYTDYNKPEHIQSVPTTT